MPGARYTDEGQGDARRDEASFTPPTAEGLGSAAPFFLPAVIGIASRGHSRDRGPHAPRGLRVPDLKSPGDYPRARPCAPHFFGPRAWHSCQAANLGRLRPAQAMHRDTRDLGGRPPRGSCGLARPLVIPGRPRMPGPTTHRPARTRLCPFTPPACRRVDLGSSGMPPIVGEGGTPSTITPGRCGATAASPAPFASARAPMSGHALASG
jgi:hypothetical protein